MTVPFRQNVAPGVEIRLLQLADAGEAFACVERNRRYLREWLPWVDATRTEADVQEFIRRVLNQWYAGKGPQCSIRLNGEFAGCVGVHPIDWINRNCSIGYWLDERRQGGGLMSRCCAALLDYLTIEQDLHRVEIRCGTGNRKSCAIPERLGFQREGVLRESEWVNDRWVDLVVWSMLRDDWQARAGR